MPVRSRADAGERRRGISPSKWFQKPLIFIRRALSEFSPKCHLANAPPSGWKTCEAYRKWVICGKILLFCASNLDGKFAAGETLLPLRRPNLFPFSPNSGNHRSKNFPGQYRLPAARHWKKHCKQCDHRSRSRSGNALARGRDAWWAELTLQENQQQCRENSQGRQGIEQSN